jgi:hypothetical protein
MAWLTFVAGRNNNAAATTVAWHNNQKTCKRIGDGVDGNVHQRLIVGGDNNYREERDTTASLMDKEDVVMTTLWRLSTYNITISRIKVKSHGW